MTRVRSFAEEDLPAVADLWRRAFRREGSPAAIQRYFREVFLDGPGRAEGIGSLCAEDDGGAIKGFIGVLPRRMLFQGRPVQAAAATQLMAAPGPGCAFVAFELVRALFAGPQDLTFSDGSNPVAQSVWVRMGGQVARPYCLEWTRVLRPAGYAQQLLERRAASARPTSIARPIARAIDAAAAMLPVPRLAPPRPHLAEQALSEDAVLRLLQTTRHPLRPAYDVPSLGWLLQKAAETRGHGRLKARLCCDDQGAPVGWYVYYAQAGGVSKALQIGGRPRALGGVLANLLADALAEGSVAITGQADPRLWSELTRTRASLACRGLDFLVHARSPEILSVIHQGEAFMTRLDGEWWLRFAVDPLVDEAVDAGSGTRSGSVTGSRGAQEWSSAYPPGGV
ncbi:MAG TPA: GNAT family N-acetyltransferase [Candidatus Nanopelagicales bacterium]|nr:GNAT family N-acetyltransferase [Candidatus Nanopelagicales bacterium]